MSFAETHKGAYGHPGVLVMGTGPFEVDSLDPTTGAQLSANPNWWGGKVPVQHISITFFNNETSEALAFRAGEIDLDPSIAAPQSFAATSGAKLLTTPSCGIGFFAMNTKFGPWSDVHVRRAVAYALNRPNIIAANGGYANPIYTLTPPSMLKTVATQSQINTLLSSLPLYPYNIAKAKAEMAESAYPTGFSATLLGIHYGSFVNVDEVIAAELQKIGIHLQIKVDTLNGWYDGQTGPDSGRLTAFTTGGCFYPDPSAYTDFLGSWNTKAGAWNMADYAPTAVDDLIKAGIATTDRAQRFAIYSKLFERLQSDVPYVGLFVSLDGVALSSKFTWPGYNQWDGDYGVGIKPST
jgi:peptide/nickel transport system substrate-binding protein